MKKIESDILVLTAVCNFIRSTGKKVEDIIPNYDRNQVHLLLNTLPIGQLNEATDKALETLANQVYKRVESKFIL